MPLIGYRNGMHVAGLRDHVDIGETHIVSAIINVEQDVDKDWPLMILDHQGNRHMVRTCLQSRDEGGNRIRQNAMYAWDDGCIVFYADHDAARRHGAVRECHQDPRQAPAVLRKVGMHHHLKGLVNHVAIVGTSLIKTHP